MKKIKLLLICLTFCLMVTQTKIFAMDNKISQTMTLEEEIDTKPYNQNKIESHSESKKSFCKKFEEILNFYKNEFNFISKMFIEMDKNIKILYKTWDIIEESKNHEIKEETLKEIKKVIENMVEIEKMRSNKEKFFKKLKKNQTQNKENELEILKKILNKEEMLERTSYEQKILEETVDAQETLKAMLDEQKATQEILDEQTIKKFNNYALDNLIGIVGAMERCTCTIKMRSKELIAFSNLKEKSLEELKEIYEKDIKSHIGTTKNIFNSVYLLLCNAVNFCKNCCNYIHENINTQQKHTTVAQTILESIASIKNKKNVSDIANNLNKAVGILKETVPINLEFKEMQDTLMENCSKKIDEIKHFFEENRNRTEKFYHDVFEGYYRNENPNLSPKDFTKHCLRDFKWSRPGYVYDLYKCYAPIALNSIKIMQITIKKLTNYTNFIYDEKDENFKQCLKKAGINLNEKQMLNLDDILDILKHLKKYLKIKTP